MDDPRPEGDLSTESPPTPEQLRELRDRAHAALADQRDHALRLEEQVFAELDRLSDEVSTQIEENISAQRDEVVAEAANELTSDRQAFEAERAEWEQLRDQIESDLEQLRLGLQQQAEAQHATAQQLLEREESAKQERHELGTWAAELAEERSQLESLRRELKQQEEQVQDASRRQASEQEASEVELVSQVRSLESQLEQAEHSHNDALASLRAQLEEAHQATTAAQEASADAQQHTALAEQWSEERTQLIEDQTSLTNRLTEAEQQLQETYEKQAKLERAALAAVELHEKFELALEDVQEHRRRVAELEQELASRPEAGADASPELVQLRAERQELLQRITDLEAQVAHAAAEDGSDSQQMEDLQRRFELAVEDVRQLKTEKADLEERLASTESQGAENEGPLDWEAQKRRLLASLDGGDETPERSEQRATIEGTIRITDEVVAEKDREIQSLREQMGQSAQHLPAVEIEPDPAEDSLSDDERLETERQRLASLEAEWEEKLRCAELELSVERAKMAREQAELAELRIELETQRKATDSPTTSASDGNPGGRNWFNKLGLGRNDE